MIVEYRSELTPKYTFLTHQIYQYLNIITPCYKFCSNRQTSIIVISLLGCIPIVRLYIQLLNYVSDDQIERDIMA